MNGLANRLRVLDSAILLCRDSGIPLEVIWGVGNGLYARLDQLLIPPEVFKNRVLNYSVVGRLGRFKKQAYLEFRGATPFDGKAIEGELLESVRSRTFYVCTCERIYSSRSSYDWIQPAVQVDQEVNMLTESKRLAERIGIHIRRTDNKRSSDVSTTQRFIKFIKEEIDLNNEATFFLSCDDADEVVRMGSLFGNRIFARDKIERSRRTWKGAVDAFVDLLCLSRTHRILGSYWSSFSIEAAKIGRIPYIEVS